jgi:rSAM/selenodomain-associated transferase 2
LIGLSREAPELFQHIPWGTSEVRAKTIDIANLLKLQWINIEPLQDVDRVEDLEVWRREVSTGGESPSPQISVIIPTLNEAGHLEETLASIENDGSLEILVVDGGSRDETVNLAKIFEVRLFTTAPHRAKQANAGALAARGDILLFLHGDTRLPPGYQSHVQNTLARPGVVAGAFVLSIDSPEIGLKMIEMLANFRSHVFHMPYGDQALFLRADLFRSMGGFPDMPIMEDFVFIQRLKKKGKISMVPVAVKTSPRRWLKLGILKTTLINQAVLLAYFLGSKPERLVRWYKTTKLRD